MTEIIKRRFVLLLITVFLLSGCQLISDKSNFLKVGGTKLKVEYAITEMEQVRGLAGRDNLCPDCGMFFVFTDYQFRDFWMQGMKFPLDIIWLKDNQIVAINENVPIEDSNGPTVISSPSMVNQVLEVNSGWCQKNNIKVGEHLTK